MLNNGHTCDMGFNIASAALNINGLKLSLMTDVIYVWLSPLLISDN